MLQASGCDEVGPLAHLWRRSLRLRIALVMTKDEEREVHAAASTLVQARLKGRRNRR